MQTANIMLNIGSDGSSIVSKENVTPAEVAVLRVIHGDDAVTDIDVLDAEAENENGGKRTHRQEIARLTEVYGKNQPEGGRVAMAVQTLFPGAAARVFENFEELELDESLFKAEDRKAPKAAKTSEPVAEADDLGKKNITDLKTLADTENVDLEGATKKADIIAKIEAARAAKVDQGDAGEGENDGIGEMNDRPSASVFE